MVVPQIIARLQNVDVPNNTPGAMDYLVESVLHTSTLSTVAVDESKSFNRVVDPNRPTIPTFSRHQPFVASVVKCGATFFYW